MIACPSCSSTEKFVVERKQVASIREVVSGEGDMEDYDIVSWSEDVGPVRITCDACGHSWTE